MLTVNLDSVYGKVFFKKGDDNTEYVCIGIGQNPNGTVFVVGTVHDSVSNRTEIKTELIRDAVFKGAVAPLPKAS